MFVPKAILVLVWKLHLVG